MGDAPIVLVFGGSIVPIVFWPETKSPIVVTFAGLL
jgi:hypothetical protein